MKGPKPYRRLAVSHQFGLATGGWRSLYLASDHLLLRSASGFVESYRRFYFADIETITIRKTDRGGLLNALWGIPLLFSLLFLIFKPGWTSAICANIFFALLAINFARGSTCVTSLQTRVQNRTLPLRRVKKALKVMDLLSGKIAAAQADITVSTAPAEIAQSAPPPLPSTSALPPPLPGHAISTGRRWVHLLSFGMLLAGGLVSIWEGLYHRPVLMYSAYAAVGLNLGWGIAALVQQRRKRLSGGVVPIAWINVIGHAIGVPIVYTSFTMLYAFQLAKIRHATGNAQPAQMGLTALREMPGFNYVLLIYGAACLLLGAIGYGLLLFAHSTTRAPNDA